VPFDNDAYERAGYPDPSDTNLVIWTLYRHLSSPVPYEVVEARVVDGTVGRWLGENFGVKLVDERRFVDYLQRAWDVETYGIGDGIHLLHAHLVEALQQALTY